MTANTVKPPIAEIAADLASSSPYIFVQSPPRKNNYLLELPDGNDSVSFLLDSREQQHAPKDLSIVEENVRKREAPDAKVLSPLNRKKEYHSYYYGSTANLKV